MSGPKFRPIPPSPTLPSFSTCSIWHTFHSFTPLASLYFHVSLPPLRFFFQIHPVGLCYRSSKPSPYVLSSHIPLLYAQNAFPFLPFSLHVPFLYSFHVASSIHFPAPSDDDRSSSSIYTLHKCPVHTSYPQYIELFLYLTLRHARSELEREGETVVTLLVHCRDGSCADFWIRFDRL